MRKFLYKIYDSAGSYIKTLNDVINQDQPWKEYINGGFSELTLQLARRAFETGEGDDISHGNILKIYAFDSDTGDAGESVYCGEITNYVPKIINNQELLEVTILSNWWGLNQDILEDDGNGINSDIYKDGLIPPMIDTNRPRPYVASADTELDSDHQAYLAFDDSLFNNWTPSGTTGILKIDLSYQRTITQYSILARYSGFETDDGTKAPKNWTFEGSNDDTNWTVLDTVTNEDSWGDNEVRYFEFSNVTAYRYYRINITVNNGDTGEVHIVKFQVYEKFSRAGNTTLKYLSKEPGAILKDILDKYQANVGGALDYDTGTVEDTGTVVSDEMNMDTYQEAIKRVIELCPDGWFVRIDGDNKVYLKSRSTTADHTFTLGKDIEQFNPEKRKENIVNKVVFRGGTQSNGEILYKVYERSGSIATYKVSAKKIVDKRITNESTADIKAGRLLDGSDSPEIRVTLKVFDKNGQNPLKGYNTRIIRPGDTCRILNSTQKTYNNWDEMLWDVEDWDYDIENASATVMQIQSVERYPDYVILEISNRQPDIAKRIEDINRNLEVAETVDNPTAPTN